MMQLPAWASRWLRWLERDVPARPANLDAADLGTAFGLDASLLDVDPADCADEAPGPLFPTPAARPPR